MKNISCRSAWSPIKLSKGTRTCSHVVTKTAKKRMFSHRIRNSEYAIINFPRKLSKHRNTLTDYMKEMQDKFTGAREYKYLHFLEQSFAEG